MTSKEIEEKTGMGSCIVRRWAKANGVKRVESVNGILAYDWSEEDLQRFLNRNTQRGTTKKKKRPGQS